MNFKSKCQIALVLICFFTACGSGGDNKKEASFQGKWLGDSFNGGINCSDGGFISAGYGIALNSGEQFEISGGSIDGEEVKIKYQDCLLQGVRELLKVNALPVSNCPASLRSVQFELNEENFDLLNFYISSDPSKVPSSDATPTCVAQAFGELVRQ